MSSLTSSKTVMVNFMCQRDWAKGGQVAGKPLFLRVSERESSEERM